MYHLIVFNNPNSNSVSFAKGIGIDTFIINKRKYPLNNEYDRVLKELVSLNQAYTQTKNRIEGKNEPKYDSPLPK